MKTFKMLVLSAWVCVQADWAPNCTAFYALPQTEDSGKDFNPDGRLPWLGVSHGLANQRQIVLYGVFPDGPAGKAGLTANDAIVSVNGEPVQDLGTFHAVIDRQRVGSRIPVAFRRGTELKTVNVLMDPLPSDGGVRQILEAIENGESWAMMELGVQLAHLRGNRSYVETDPIAAAQWFWRAVDAGDNCALVFLAQMYIRGVGVEQDFAAAQQLLIRARKLADEPDRSGVRIGLASAASLELARMCLDGQGPDANRELAISFLEDAATNGSPVAMFQLGEIHSHGTIQPRDLEQARQWLSLAAQNGHAPATVALDRLDQAGAANATRPGDANTVADIPDDSASTTIQPHDSDGRYVWAHDGGFFRYCGNKYWIESFRPLTNQAGGFSFTEKARNDHFVELYDSSRDLTVRIDASQVQVIGPDFPELTRMYGGRWLPVATFDKQEP